MKQLTFEDFRLQGAEIEALRILIQDNRMIHALLISGEPGTGKKTLALLFAAAMFCTDDAERPCGRCNNCQRVMDKSYPDLVLIEKGLPLAKDSQKSRNTISVDDIREMIRISSAYPLEGQRRVVIIAGAESMTDQAQNCLLKTLEEPPENTYFILTSSHPEQLLPTVISRCRPLKLKPWNEKTIEQVLLENGVDKPKAHLASLSSNGSVGLALKLAVDDMYWKTRKEIIDSFFNTKERSRIAALSAQWKDRKSEGDILYEILEECVRAMLMYRIEGCGEELLQSFSAEWKDFAATAHIDRFTGLFDRIHEARRQSSFNVNFQVIVEQLLFSFLGEIMK